MTATIKTYEGWRESRLDLGRFLQVDDLVDDEMFDYFLGVLPPEFYSSTILQIGEPSNHVGGRPTFQTLKRTPAGWAYRGTCFRGETIPR
jgi:hypothetical protein